MFFSTSIVALVSLLPLAALALPAGFKSVTTADLSTISATSKFLIASEKFNTQLNIAGNRTGDGNPVIMYTPNTASSPNQQWFLNNVVGSPNEYTIESIEAPTFLSFPGARASTSSIDGQTIIDCTCYPTYTIQQITPGANQYKITENTFGGILSAWALYAQGGTVGAATFESESLGSAQVWQLFAAPA